MLSQLPLLGFGIELKPITIDKLEIIRGWRNHPDIVSNMIDKSYISSTQQKSWFDSLADKKHQLHLLICYKGEDIGIINAASVNNEEHEKTQPLWLAESIAPGLYIAPECKYKNSVLAFSPSLVFIDYLFKEGCCRQLIAQVYEHNNSAIRYNKMLGYQQVSIDNDGLVTMTLSNEAFEHAKNKLSKTLRFNK